MLDYVTGALFNALQFIEDYPMENSATPQRPLYRERSTFFSRLKLFAFQGLLFCVLLALKILQR